MPSIIIIYYIIFNHKDGNRTKYITSEYLSYRTLSTLSSVNIDQNLEPIVAICIVHAKFLFQQCDGQISDVSVTNCC